MRRFGHHMAVAPLFVSLVLKIDSIQIFPIFPEVLPRINVL